MAPIAAISFTSPAPVAPSRCPGIISADPTTNPSSEAAERQAAEAGGRQADPDTGHRRRQHVRDAPRPNVDDGRDERPGCDGREGGTRHWRQSSSRKLFEWCSRPCVTAPMREERDESREQAVLEQVLALFRAAEPAGYGKLLVRRRNW